MHIKTRGFGTVAIWGIIALILIVGGAGYVLTQKGGEETTLMDKQGEAMTEKEEGAMADKKDDSMMKEDSTMMDKESDTTMETEGAMMKKSGTYEEYAASKISLAAKEDVVLFFHASWCPICRSIEAEINKDPSKIPAGVHILKVNYDQEVALRQKYGVTVQHTFVQVDAQGNSLGKWSDQTTLAGVLGRIK